MPKFTCCFDCEHFTVTDVENFCNADDERGADDEHKDVCEWGQKCSSANRAACKKGYPPCPQFEKKEDASA